jgi:hypothetical protein
MTPSRRVATEKDAQERSPSPISVACRPTVAPARLVSWGSSGRGGPRWTWRTRISRACWGGRRCWPSGRSGRLATAQFSASHLLLSGSIACWTGRPSYRSTGSRSRLSLSAVTPCSRRGGAPRPPFSVTSSRRPRRSASRRTCLPRRPIRMSRRGDRRPRPPRWNTSRCDGWVSSLDSPPTRRAFWSAAGRWRT